MRCHCQQVAFSSAGCAGLSLHELYSIFVRCQERASLKPGADAASTRPLSAFPGWPGLELAEHLVGLDEAAAKNELLKILRLVFAESKAGLGKLKAGNSGK